MVPVQRFLLVMGRLGFLAACVFTLFAAFARPADAPHVLPWDKANHFLAFYVLTILGGAAFPRLKPLRLGSALIAPGAAIEIIQATPWVARDSDIRDWAADSVGVAFALAPRALGLWRRAITLRTQD